MMADIAEDELRHAEFSMALDDWLRPHLAPAEQDRVDRTADKARRRLAAEAGAELPPGVRRALGLPDRAQSAALWAAIWQ